MQPPAVRVQISWVDMFALHSTMQGPLMVPLEAQMVVLTWLLLRTVVSALSLLAWHPWCGRCQEHYHVLMYGPCPQLWQSKLLVDHSLASLMDVLTASPALARDRVIQMLN